MKITKFMKKVSDPGVIEYLRRDIPESLEEMVKMTRAYCKGKKWSET